MSSCLPRTTFLTHLRGLHPSCSCLFVPNHRGDCIPSPRPTTSHLNSHDSSRPENHNPQTPFSILCLNSPQPPSPPPLPSLVLEIPSTIEVAHVERPSDKTSDDFGHSLLKIILSRHRLLQHADQAHTCNFLRFTPLLYHCIAISYCCTRTLSPHAKEKHRVFSPTTFWAGMVCIAIPTRCIAVSCCCMQHRGVACNVLVCVESILQSTVEQMSRCSGGADPGTVGGCADMCLKTESSSGLPNRSLTPQLRR